MSEHQLPRAIAAAWQPQLPGRRAARDVRDPIVEPDWGGARVVAALTESEAALYSHGEEVEVPEPLLRALLDGFRALGAVIEGHVTPEALRTGEGAYPRPPTVERPPILVPRVFRPSQRDDPYLLARDHQAQARHMEPAVLEAIERGEPHAFVATDLLWLDGQPLLEVPLLERKRLLETVLDESSLVRVTAFVRPSTARILATWGTLGFHDLFYRGANSRYLPGRENPDWSVARAPGAEPGSSRPAARGR